MSDQTQHIQQQIETAVNDGHKLSIQASGSHDFMLPDYAESQQLDMSEHNGIIDYQPTELTLKARAGTPLTEIRDTLAKHQQRLATDIPQFSDDATIGGALAIGHSGSSRPFLGSLRDHVLGAGLINGRGELLNCGGQVMKNVAGYDVSRLLSGSRGTLGAILDITLKVTPQAEQQLTLSFEMTENQAIETMNKMAALPLPLSGCMYFDGQLFIRLQGSSSGIKQAQQTLGGELLGDYAGWWQDIQNQSLPFFQSAASLWRIIVPSTTPRLQLETEHKSLIDWCGGLRWIHANDFTQSDFIHISNMGGYVEKYRGENPTRPADLMSPLQRQMHTRIKQAFDPQQIFNPALSDFA
jgi:glycolate oxidase FAD binding subunit